MKVVAKYHWKHEKSVYQSGIVNSTISVFGHFKRVVKDDSIFSKNNIITRHRYGRMILGMKHVVYALMTHR